MGIVSTTQQDTILGKTYIFYYFDVYLLLFRMNSRDVKGMHLFNLRKAIILSVETRIGFLSIIYHNTLHNFLVIWWLMFSISSMILLNLSLLTWRGNILNFNFIFYQIKSILKYFIQPGQWPISWERKKILKTDFNKIWWLSNKLVKY